MKRLLAIAALVLLAAPAFSQTPSLTFTLQTSTNDGKSVIPKLTWSTTPAATSCTASGTTDWTGTKTAAGSVTLAAVNVTKTFALVCNWPGISVAAVSWVPPTINTDGSPLTDLSGFRIMYGRGPTEPELDTSFYLQVPTATSWTSPALAAGTWYFGVKVFNTLGLESALSNVASKTMTAAASDQRALALTIRYPSPATGVQ